MTPYDTIAEIIKKWCESHIYEDFLVTINMNGTLITEVLEFDANTVDFIWLTDWWEGEENVSLFGFCPIKNIKCYGFPHDQVWHLREE